MPPAAASPTLCLFVSDLHGRPGHYQALLDVIHLERPSAVFLGGDLLPGVRDPDLALQYVRNVLIPTFSALQTDMGTAAPVVFLILGNDDPRIIVPEIDHAAHAGVWRHIHNRIDQLASWTVFGYACIPPTPFLLKDWERYDVSRYVDPGCLSPEEGWLSVPQPEADRRWRTIQSDLSRMAEAIRPSRSIGLFHTPPHHTPLDRAALDGKMVDGVPLDVHVGSVAVRRFIEHRRPAVTLHGHIHESARLTGSWKTCIGDTWAFSAAHDGPELALVRFHPEQPEQASRHLLPAVGPTPRSTLPQRGEQPCVGPE